MLWKVCSLGVCRAWSAFSMQTRDVEESDEATAPSFACFHSLSGTSALPLFIALSSSPDEHLGVKSRHETYPLHGEIQSHEVIERTGSWYPSIANNLKMCEAHRKRLCSRSNCWYFVAGQSPCDAEVVSSWQGFKHDNILRDIVRLLLGNCDSPLVRFWRWDVVWLSVAVPNLQHRPPRQN